VLVLGLMSGTSADGMDAALVRITGAPPRLRAQLLGSHQAPFPAPVRAAILRLANGAPTRTAELSNLNFLLGQLFARTALEALKKLRVPPRRVALIGSHGQTVFHQGAPARFLGPPVASTLQIGEPAVIAERTGIPTVGDFRVADVAAGGQGAPLVPFVDYLLYRHPRIARVALNIGGIANVTVIPAGAGPGQVLAFDTGPGNMVVDALVSRFTRGRQSFDRGARLARRGRLLPALLDELLAHAYFHKRPPKTCGREQFGASYSERLIAWGRRRRARPEDLLRTATLLTPLAVVDAFHRFVAPRLRAGRRRAIGARPAPPIQLIAAGGGAHNPLIRAQLEAGLRGSGVEVVSSGALGVPEDAKEAFAFALLAYESFHGRPANLPSATGAQHPCLLGKLCRPR
jgi:anhydro-N-acetylmuramic acid kinase